MTEMYNPPHPGQLVREWLGQMPISHAAERLHVSRDLLSRIVHGKSAITADMALRLSDATGMRPKLWLDLQTQYDLWHASRTVRPRIQPFDQVA